MRVLTLDAAQTLIKTSWEPGQFALDCAEKSGIYLGESDAEVYRSLLANRWKTYEKLNESRDPVIVADFWLELTKDWLSAIQEDVSKAPYLMLAGNDLLYSASSPYFSLYDDTMPALKALADIDVRMAIISNWDVSLHRVCACLGISRYFEVIVASLEEGMEKPDPRLFEITFNRMGVDASEVVHVGDNPIDDMQGARNAGVRGLLLDRDRQSSEGNMLHSLLAIPEVLGWT